MKSVSTPSRRSLRVATSRLRASGVETATRNVARFHAFCPSPSGSALRSARSHAQESSVMPLAYWVHDLEPISVQVHRELWDPLLRAGLPRRFLRRGVAAPPLLESRAFTVCDGRDHRSDDVHRRRERWSADGSAISSSIRFDTLRTRSADVLPRLGRRHGEPRRHASAS